MSKIAAVWRREFRQFWLSPVAYIVICVFLVISTWLFMKGFFIVNDASMDQLFGLIPWFFLFLLPALTMRQWAEEQASGTIELLMTQPVSEREVVWGKYLSTVTLLAVILILTVPLTLTVSALSQNGLDGGVVFANYLGAFLLGSAFLAIGGWISSFTRNQIIAFILSIAVIFGLIIVGESMVTIFIGKGASWLVPALEYIGLRQHYGSMQRGVIDTRDLFYYVSVIWLFLYLTTRAVESRRWS
ncbi:ABC transporter permease subunit [bacterium]|nr:ABC transporter permease subunit [bacterium]